MAVIIPSKIPGALETITGQSLFTFKEAYNTQAVQLMVVMIGNTTDPGCPDIFKRI